MTRPLANPNGPYGNHHPRIELAEFTPIEAVSLYLGKRTCESGETMAESKFKCIWCGMIVTTSGSRPDPKTGGPCTRNQSPKKEHYWSSA